MRRSAIRLADEVLRKRNESSGTDGDRTEKNEGGVPVTAAMVASAAAPASRRPVSTSDSHAWLSPVAAERAAPG